jgi:hypothetical protein
MKKQQGNFRTHIPEPRWQQIASVIIVVLAVALWLWVALN